MLSRDALSLRLISLLVENSREGREGFLISGGLTYDLRGFFAGYAVRRHEGRWIGYGPKLGEDCEGGHEGKSPAWDGKLHGSCLGLRALVEQRVCKVV